MMKAVSFESLEGDTVGDDANEWGLSSIKVVDKKIDSTSIAEKQTFDHTLLPDIVSPFIKDIAQGMNAPVSFAGIGVLTVISSAIGARLGIRLKLKDDWTITPNLWGIFIAPPSIKKSPIFNEVLIPLKRAEYKRREEHKENAKEYNKEKGVYDIKVKKHIKEIAEGTESTPPQIGRAPAQTRYIINDATVEKVGDIMVANPKGLLVAVDELSGFIKTFDRAGREGDRSFWLTAFSGDTDMSVDRIQRGSTYIPNLCASILGTIQPDILSKLVDDSINGGGDGLIQRFQLLAIEDHIKYEAVDRYPNVIARDAYCDIVTQILNTDPISRGAIQANRDKIPYFRVSTEANKIYREWDEKNHKKIAHTEKENAPYASHLGKFGSLLGSLTLIFFYVDRVSNKISDDEIPKKYVENAIKLCAFFEQEALKLYDLPKAKDRRSEQLRDRILTRLHKEDLPITYGQLSGNISGAKSEDCKKLLKGHVKEEDGRIVKIL